LAGHPSTQRGGWPTDRAIGYNSPVALSLSYCILRLVPALMVSLFVKTWRVTWMTLSSIATLAIVVLLLLPPKERQVSARPAEQKVSAPVQHLTGGGPSHPAGQPSEREAASRRGPAGRSLVSGAPSDRQHGGALNGWCHDGRRPLAIQHRRAGQHLRRMAQVAYGDRKRREAARQSHRIGQIDRFPPSRCCYPPG